MLKLMKSFADKGHSVLKRINKLGKIANGVREHGEYSRLILYYYHVY